MVYIYIFFVLIQVVIIVDTVTTCASSQPSSTTFTALPSVPGQSTQTAPDILSVAGSTPIQDETPWSDKVSLFYIKLFSL